MVSRILSSVLIKSKDLFAGPTKATAAATHPDTLTEITASAATKVAEQANDVFTVDPPSLRLVPSLSPPPWNLHMWTRRESTGGKEVSCTPPLMYLSEFNEVGYAFTASASC